MSMLQAQVFFEKDELIDTQSQEEFILKFLIRNNISNATVLRAQAGFGSNHALKRPDMLFSFDEIPMLIVFTDEEEKVAEAIRKLKPLLKHCEIFTTPVTKW